MRTLVYTIVALALCLVVAAGVQVVLTLGFTPLAISFGCSLAIVLGLFVVTTGRYQTWG